MKRAVVELKVLVTCTVPDHIVERDTKEFPELSEKDIWHDYAIEGLKRHVKVCMGQDEENDWVEIETEPVEAEFFDEPEDVQ